MDFRGGMRYEGHRPKHARLHNHGRPSPPHARHPGNVQDATAPMPTKSGRTVRHMQGGLSEAYSYPSLAQSLLALPHCRSNRRRLKPGPPGFFGAHERRGRAHSGGVATRGTILRGHLTTGASWHGPGCSRRRVSRDTGSARARTVPLLTSCLWVDRLSCARARATHARARRGPTPQAAHPAPG